MDAYRISDSIAQMSIGITPGSLVRIKGADMEMSVVYGSLWVTEETGAGDIYLQTDASLRLERHRVTVVSAFKPSLVTLTPHASQRDAARVSMARPGTAESVELFEMDERRKSGGLDATGTTFRYPTAEQVERSMQDARRLRSETVYQLLRSALAWLAGGPRTRTPESRGIPGAVYSA